jgi:hypothetical protein
MAFEGSERKVLHAILREQGGAQAGYVDDFKVAEIADLSIDEVRDCLETLEAKECVERSVGLSGHSAYITARGRQELRRSQAEAGGGDEAGLGRIKVVPKGLRSYDEHDAYFFLELLPGPRQSDGLPESIHYWKVRIEELNPDRTFRVGLIYGPSGCGKSSFIKAGLLPRLDDYVQTVYVEATAEKTEHRILNELRKRCPGPMEEAGLVETLAAISDCRAAACGKKMLIVLDQFEQWLSTWRGEGCDLICALRHCDGRRVQAIIMVRDDFWMPVNRFERQLDIEFRRTLNSYGMDLFDQFHAKQVLTEFGKAFGRLPNEQDDISDDQHAFLDQAVAGLTQDGNVVPVRLSLFAWMVRGRSWDTATLREVGGTEGVGVKFLEEAFNSPYSEPKYRLHQKAARPLLKALLPPGDMNIRGEPIAYSELLQASGYMGNMQAFESLLRILDTEIRLITVSWNSASDEQDQGSDVPLGERYYQLTHDYLVDPVRRWLNMRLRESEQGRAQLLLDRLVYHWEHRPSDRSESAYVPLKQEIGYILANIDPDSVSPHRREIISEWIRKRDYSFFRDKTAMSIYMVIGFLPAIFLSFYLSYNYEHYLPIMRMLEFLNVKVLSYIFSYFLAFFICVLLSAFAAYPIAGLIHIALSAIRYIYKYDKFSFECMIERSYKRFFRWLDFLHSVGSPRGRPPARDRTGP